MGSYNLLHLLIFLFEPVDDILPVNRKTKLVWIVLLPEQLQFGILHTEILVVFGRMKLACNGYGFSIE